MKRSKQLISLIMILALMVPSFLTCAAALKTENLPNQSKIQSTSRLDDYIISAVEALRAENGISEGDSLLKYCSAFASSTGSDWTAIALSRFGMNDSENGKYTHLLNEGYSEYLSAMKMFAAKSYADAKNNSDKLSPSSPTEWYRAIITIASLGGDPADLTIDDRNKINMISDFCYNCILEKTPADQGVNGLAWGLIALNTQDYEPENDAEYSKRYYIVELLKRQLKDGCGGNEYGGWVLGGFGNASDVDITAMVILALSPYYNDTTSYTYISSSSNQTLTRTVRQSIDDAIDKLSSLMNENACFTSWGNESCESVAQVITALCSLGIDPAKDERFITSGGKNLIDGLLDFRLPGGGFCHIKNSKFNHLALNNALCALVSCWRLENGLRSFYDMKNEHSEKMKALLTALNSDIITSDKESKEEVYALLCRYYSIPGAERRYIYNFSLLSDCAHSLNIDISEIEKNTQVMPDEDGKDTSEEKTVFSERDISAVMSLPEPENLTLAYLSEVNALSEKFNESHNRDGLSDIKVRLQNASERLEQITLTLNAIKASVNGRLSDSSYLSVFDKKYVYDIYQSYLSLSDYDRNMLDKADIECIISAKMQIDILHRNAVVTFVLLISGIALAVTVIIRYKKRKRIKKLQKMSESDE